jgi:hypothetical protein
MRVGNLFEERLAGRTATMDGPASRAENATRAAGLRGEQVMGNRQDPASFEGESAQIRSCWMCGIRLPVRQLMADGGDACADVRWYCRDTWGCTRRWTSHPARPAAIRPDVAETEAPDEQVAGPARPMTVMPV